MQNIRLLSLIMFTVIICGCGHVATKNKAASVDKSLTKSLPDIGEKWKVDVSLSVSDEPWIRSFNDPVLEELVEEALANNRQLVLAEAKLEQAKAMAKKAGATLLPNVALAGLSGNKIAASSARADANSLELGVNVNWELDVWGRIRSSQLSALKGADAAEADLQFAQYSIAATTIRSYLLAVEASIQKRVVQQSVDLLVRTERTVTIMHENGIAQPTDVALTKSELASERDTLVQINIAQRDALRALELLLGRYPGADIELRKELPDLPNMVPTGIPSELLARRPDIVAASNRVYSAYFSTKEARAARLPSFSLSGNLGAASDSLSSFLDAKHVALQLGFSLLAPIIDGGGRKADIEIATSAQKAALADYANTTLTAFAEVESVLDQGSALSRRVAFLQESVDQAEKAFNIAKITYDGGELDLLDLLQIQARLIKARSDFVSIRRLAIEQRVNLNLALGGTWIRD